MKSLLFLGLILSSQVFAQNLAGRWRNTDDGSLINFLSLDGAIREYSTQKFTNPRGALLYTIGQAVTLPDSGERRVEGFVDFYDSRGCSFEGLPVLVEFQNLRTINVLMTVPRYTTRPCRVLEYVDVPVELKKL